MAPGWMVYPLPAEKTMTKMAPSRPMAAHFEVNFCAESLLRRSQRHSESLPIQYWECPHQDGGDGIGTAGVALGGAGMCVGALESGQAVFC